MSCACFDSLVVKYLEKVLSILLNNLFAKEKSFREAVKVEAFNTQAFNTFDPERYQKIWRFSSIATDGNDAVLIYAEHPRNDVCPADSETNPYYLECCVVDAITEFLCQKELSFHDFGKDFCFRFTDGTSMNYEQAADELLKYITARINDFWEKVYGFSFDTIDKLSLAKYEKAESRGRIVIIDPACMEEDNFIRLASPVSVDAKNIRLLRKLMTGAGGKDAALLFYPENYNKVCCYGIIKDSKKCNVKIDIMGPYNWWFIFYGNILFRRRTNDYEAHLDTKRIIKRRLEAALISEFGESCTNASAIATRLCEMSATHGAAVLIVDRSSDCLNERFKTLCDHKKALDSGFDGLNLWEDDPNNLKVTEMFSYVASMDGAVVIDLNGYVLYSAMILDGASCTEGDSARGARYNSINNFVTEFGNKNTKIIGIVMSEDGGQDVICGHR